MKKFFISILCGVFLLISTICYATPFLVCDPPTDANISISEIEVTHNGFIYYTSGIVELSPDGASIHLLDLNGFANGNYTFRARWSQVDENGDPIWWSEWSDPLNIVKAGKPENIKIKMR